jgi:hypothetical protein
MPSATSVCTERGGVSIVCHGLNVPRRGDNPIGTRKQQLEQEAAPPLDLNLGPILPHRCSAAVCQLSGCGGQAGSSSGRLFVSPGES